MTVKTLVHARRGWGQGGGASNGSVCNTTFVAYDLLNASA